LKVHKKYKPRNPVRIVSATSLFDGHDVAINIMRRIMQATGAEVIHLGHNRSVEEIVECAIQEDAQGIAVTSYQGGHLEFFRYMMDYLRKKNAGYIKVFGGGGGVILPDEIETIHKFGVSRIFSPDDGRKMGLQGMVNEVIRQCDFPASNISGISNEKIIHKDYQAIARLISVAENDPDQIRDQLTQMNIDCRGNTIPVVGITGTGGAGKSSVIDEVVRRYLQDYPDNRVGIIAVDPSKRKTGGALLGDRIRMNAITHEKVYMRSMGTRRANVALSDHIREVLCILKYAQFDLIILESSGIGQSDTEIVDYCDIPVYIMTPEFGAATQLEKIDMLDYADMVVVNKSDKMGADDALRDVRKQMQRNRQQFDVDTSQMPVFSTVASDYNDPGINIFYNELVQRISSKPGKKKSGEGNNFYQKTEIIPKQRVRYLSEITDLSKDLDEEIEKQVVTADQLYGIKKTIELVKQDDEVDKPSLKHLEKLYAELKNKLDTDSYEQLISWDEKKKKYMNKKFIYTVRKQKISVDTHTESLSHLRIPKVSMPRYQSWGDILGWLKKENVPGEFPYTAGVFPFKREGEDPTRMFAGEGGPARTNKRFHLLSEGQPARRLSTAFDSVSLYGSDPDIQPDIYGKIGNSGVSVACLDDTKKLYSGFNLLDPKTSVSMTINGPAPMLVGYFFNTAIDQQCELYIREQGLESKVEEHLSKKYDKRNLPRPAYQGKLPSGNNGLGLLLLGTTGDKILPPEIYQKIKAETISKVRGTVQADILKEDQAQNTCIFAIDFALKMMGDIQEYFILNDVQNFYSISISGYHIAEAGANPITQLAFTLANGFTYLEYYLSRGMKVDDIAKNLSFFFSNGIDPEYVVIGRVARRIWSRAIKYKYGGNERSQKLKYHIQTSGRSLHAQEIEFNDIRTTLQALHAIYDNCNSLHTNAFDEAITTPTEESVRRAMAIQLIINRELGLNKNQNPLQGSFIIEELTDLVEEAVLSEFNRISDRGGVLGAMETMYQRSKIQEESLFYERLKHEGQIPIVGVNTFLSSKGSPTIVPTEVVRATKKEKDYQIRTIQNLKKVDPEESERNLSDLQRVVLKNQNIFESLMEATKTCSLGQITQTLFEVGGQYRRNM